LGHFRHRRIGHQAHQLFQIADDPIVVAELTPDRPDRSGTVDKFTPELILGHRPLALLRELVERP
jgi:hypothetical protein